MLSALVYTLAPAVLLVYVLSLGPAVATGAYAYIVNAYEGTNQ